MKCFTHVNFCPAVFQFFEHSRKQTDPMTQWKSDFSYLNPDWFSALYYSEQQIPKETVECINFREVHMYPKAWKVLKSAELFVNFIS